MEYTKGEWKVIKNWPFPDQQGKTGYAVYNTINKTDMLICELVHAVDRKNEEANANLISAAPDMYEALKALLKAYEVDDGYEQGYLPEYWEQALKAIAKSEGR